MRRNTTMNNIKQYYLFILYMILTVAAMGFALGLGAKMFHLALYGGW